MTRIILLLSIVALAGCANTAPRQSPEEWLNQQAQQEISAVVRSCAGTHLNYVDGKSPVDCTTLGYNHLRMSFPDRKIYLKYEQGIGEYFGMWCTSIANRSGRFPAIQLEIREEGRSFEVPCERLLNRMKENDQRVETVQ